LAYQLTLVHLDSRQIVEVLHLRPSTIQLPKSLHPSTDLRSSSECLARLRYLSQRSIPWVELFRGDFHEVRSLTAYLSSGQRRLTPGFQPQLRYVFRFSQPLDVLIPSRTVATFFHVASAQRVPFSKPIFPSHQYHVSMAYPFMLLVLKPIANTKDTPKDTK
jgi:hypothetical protein